MFDLRLLFVALVWGVNFSAVKYALADFSPLSFTVARFLLASIFLLCVMAAARIPFAMDRRDRFAVARLGLVGITLYNVFFMYGLKHTSASHSALFISLSPLFAVLLQAASGRERITQRVTAGVLLAMAGVFLVINGRSGDTGATTLAGDLLTLVAALLWAVYTVSSQPLLERHSPVKVTAYSMCAGSVLLLVPSIPDLAQQPWAAVSGSAWAAFAFSAFVSGGISFSLWYEGIRRIGVAGTAAYHYLVPFVAVLFAALFLGEQFTLRQACGGAAIIFGIMLVQKRSSKA